MTYGNAGIIIYHFLFVYFFLLLGRICRKMLLGLIGPNRLTNAIIRFSDFPWTNNVYLIELMCFKYYLFVAYLFAGLIMDLKWFTFLWLRNCYSMFGFFILSFLFVFFLCFNTIFFLKAFQTWLYCPLDYNFRIFRVVVRIYCYITEYPFIHSLSRL